MTDWLEQAEMWLACHTEQEIAESTVSREVESLLQIGSSSKMQQTHAFYREEDFTPPLKSSSR